MPRCALAEDKEDTSLILTSKHLVFPQPAEALCALSHVKCPGGRNFRFRVVVTKIVETLRPPRRGGRTYPVL